MNITDSTRKAYMTLAYSVLKDSISFYFGIPVFISSIDYTTEVDKAFTIRREKQIKKLGRSLTEKEVRKVRKSAERSVDACIKFWKDDFEYCRRIIFEDNIWLNILGLSTDYMEKFISEVPEEERKSMAIVPELHKRYYFL